MNNEKKLKDDYNFKLEYDYKFARKYLKINKKYHQNEAR